MKKINPQTQNMHSLVDTLDKPIVMVGMMGAGKSHVGAALARMLMCEFYDSDTEIEKKAGMPIPDIFEAFGEEKFRQAESNTIIELLDVVPSVIATGGGALTTPQTLQALKDRATMIWLDVDIESLWARIKNSDRPLIQTPNPKDTLKSLMAERRELYAQAHIHIADAANLKQTLNRICENLVKP